MLTMRPLAARKGPRNAWVTLKTPVRLMAMMSSQSLITASVAPVMPLRRAMPALLTRIVTGPTLLATCLAAHRQARASGCRRQRAGIPRAVRGARRADEGEVRFKLSSSLRKQGPQRERTALIAPPRPLLGALRETPFAKPGPVVMGPCFRRDDAS